MATTNHMRFAGATSPPRVYGGYQSAQGLRGLPVRPGSTGATSPPRVYEGHQSAQGLRGPPVRPGSTGATSPPRVYGGYQSAQGLRGPQVRPGSTGATSPPRVYRSCQSACHCSPGCTGAWGGHKVACRAGRSTSCPGSRPLLAACA